MPFFHLAFPLKLTLSCDGGCGSSEVNLIIFKRYTSKDFSFTDCTSFSIMRALRLKSAFAFDKYFEQFEGIDRLP